MLSLSFLLLTIIGLKSVSAQSYPECSGCTVYFVDDKQWGIENNDWCSKYR